MDSSLRQTLRQRHESRLAERDRLEEARRRAEEEQERQEEIERREQAEARQEALLPVLSLQGEVDDLAEIVETANNPNQVIPALRRVTDSASQLSLPDDAPDEVGALQASVGRVITALTDNPRLVLRLGSYEYRTIRQLAQELAVFLGVEVEVAEPHMDTTRDEEVARELAQRREADLQADEELARQLAGQEEQYLPNEWRPASSSSSVAPVRVNPELERYRELLIQLRSLRFTRESQVRALLQGLPPPTADTPGEPARQALQALVDYVRRRWSGGYEVEEDLLLLEDWIENL